MLAKNDARNKNPVRGHTRRDKDNKNKRFGAKAGSGGGGGGVAGTKGCPVHTFTTIIDADCYQ